MMNFERISRDKLSRTRPPSAKLAKVSTNKVLYKKNNGKEEKRIPAN